MSVLARADGVLGELVLRRRGGDVELVSNGAFLMDSGDASTERRLATAALSRLSGSAWHVLVAGLGLGFTATAVLDDPRVEAVTVVEIEPALVGWLREGLLPDAARLLDDDRLSVRVGDVAEVVPALPADSVDVVLLDVDNGPGFLVHPRNARLYRPRFLTAAARALRPGGVVAVWCAEEAPDLVAALESAVGTCSSESIVVRRDGRDLEYWLLLAGAANG